MEQFLTNTYLDLVLCMNTHTHTHIHAYSFQITKRYLTCENQFWGKLSNRASHCIFTQLVDLTRTVFSRQSGLGEITFKAPETTPTEPQGSLALKEIQVHKCFNGRKDHCPVNRLLICQFESYLDAHLH